MRKLISKKFTVEERALEGGIEWIVARELAPLQDEILRLRAYVEALHDARQTW
jgi:hypothetical protein